MRIAFLLRVYSTSLFFKLPIFYKMLLPHSDDDISLFMPLFDIAVRLGDLLQRINPVYDRFDLSRLDQLCEEDKIFDLLTCWPQTRSRKLYLFTAALCCP